MRLLPKVAKYGNWTGSGSYDVEETEVKISMHRKSGKSYPEGGYSQEIEINICPTCFDEIVLPFFKTKGVDPKIIEWEY